MKLLIISQLPPPVHGSTVMTQRFMEALDKCGFDSRIVERNFSRNQEDVERVTVGKVLKIPALCFRLIKTIVSFRPTIAIFYITVGLGSFLVDCLLLFILRIFRVDYVLYMHGRGLRKWGVDAALPMKILAQKSLSSALGGIVLGENLKDDINIFISGDRLINLPNGIPDNVPQDWDRGANLERNGVITVLFLSNLLPDKGPMNFLRMAAKVHDEEKKVQFILAGNPGPSEFSAMIDSFIGERNMDSYVVMPGGVYGNEKEQLFQNADIFVFPTSYPREAFPVVNLEAMQWALPVISSPIGAISEAVLDGINGYIVEPEDIEAMASSVLKLIRDPELRRAMGRKGRERFEQEYSLDAFERKVKETMNFFMALQEQNRTGVK